MGEDGVSPPGAHRREVAPDHAAGRVDEPEGAGRLRRGPPFVAGGGDEVPRPCLMGRELAVGQALVRALEREHAAAPYQADQVVGRAANGRGSGVPQIGLPAMQESERHRLSIVVVDADPSSVAGIPQHPERIAPGVRRVPGRNQVPSPADPARVGGVGNRVALSPVVEGILAAAKRGPEVPHVRQVVVVERPEHPGVHESADRVDRREEDVEVRVGPAQARDRLLHVQEALDLHANIVGPVASLERLEHVVREVVAPLVDAQRGAALDRPSALDRRVVVVDRPEAARPE